jgi:succinoglycan biosynthesis protein ExoM
MYLSVIICTKNRLDKLQTTLHRLKSQKLSVNLDWDIVIVDNSRLGTARQMGLEFGRCMPTKYCHCPEPGVARARNFGVQNTDSDIIVFLDDDSYPVSDLWLSAFVQAIRAKPEMSFFGGLSILDQRLILPNWFEQNRQKFRFLTAEYHRDWVSDAVSESALPYSLNLALVRSRFGPIHFREELGKGLFPGSTGEETALIGAAIKCGKLGAWVKDAVVVHDVGINRVNLKNLLIAYWGRGRSGFRSRTTAPSTLGEILRFFRHLSMMFLGLIRLPFGFTIGGCWRAVLGEYIQQLGICFESASATVRKLKLD